MDIFFKKIADESFHDLKASPARTHALPWELNIAHVCRGKAGFFKMPPQDVQTAV
jgi:hypothetical protein